MPMGSTGRLPPQGFLRGPQQQQKASGFFCRIHHISHATRVCPKCAQEKEVSNNVQSQSIQQRPTDFCDRCSKGIYITTGEKSFKCRGCGMIICQSCAFSCKSCGIVMCGDCSSNGYCRKAQCLSMETKHKIQRQKELDREAELEEKEKNSWKHPTSKKQAKEIYDKMKNAYWSARNEVKSARRNKSNVAYAIEKFREAEVDRDEAKKNYKNF